MKVVCISLGGRPPTKEGWLTVDSEYLVLAMTIVPADSVEFRVLADDGHTPILADSRLFSAVAQPLPVTWQCSVSPDGTVRIASPEFLEHGYWERFFDGDRHAVATFRSVFEELARSH